MTETTVYAIGRCPVKGCRHARRHQFPGIIRSDRLSTWTSWSIPTEAGGQHPVPIVGGRSVPFSYLARYALRNRSRDDVDPYSPDGTLMAYAEAMLSLDWVCLDHDRFCTVRTVSGVLNISRACNSRCINATGGDRECECAGAQHGAGHDLATVLF